MCGIIAVVRRPSSRTAPPGLQITTVLAQAQADLAARSADPVEMDRVAGSIAEVDHLLRGLPGLVALTRDPALLSEVTHLARALDDEVAVIEAELDSLETDAQLTGAGADLEAVNAALIRLKDAVWAIEHDRVRTAREVARLAGPAAAPAALGAYLSIQQALSALDRLEVRGRDSAGLHVLVRGHQLDLRAGAVAAELADRSHDPLFGSGAVAVADGHLGFVYKAAAEIGELGDNTRALRRAIAADDLLRRALAASTAEAVVLGHTRWASVGIISQANAHPLNSQEQLEHQPDGGPGGGTAPPPTRWDPAGPSEPYLTAVLNGDVDNFADLKATEGLRIPVEITTDAKVIPTLTSRHLRSGCDLVEAFRRCVDALEGSVAIGASSASDPADLLLALRGSGQALYVGLAEDTYVVASEPYGVVEEADHYLRLDGETPADAANASATRGQVVRLRGTLAGTVEGIERIAYDGTPLPVDAHELAEAQTTTRDIDRGDAPHFLLKEISEAPSSFLKTLRGRIVDRGGHLHVTVGDETLSPGLRSDLAAGRIRRILVIGQGTAAVAGQSLATVLTEAIAGDQIQCRALLATELSGFELAVDLSDTLVVAISQSGTTTDTNRTVDLVRARGGRVVAVVNRRNSDLTDKADGVLYTSDGRDIEMSVASTKAFYAQIAAGFVLGLAIAEEAGLDPTYPVDSVLAGLRDLPDQMRRTLELRPVIAEAAAGLAPSRRYWAVVGNGQNRIAANEVRIKASELCYKSIACDATEDKKHIDLSSEPLILVCAAGLTGSNADDVAKEVAIYRAHKATPIVIATEGEERYTAALQALTVPATHPRLGFILAAMVGHLFGYEAALAIDAQAALLREARASIEQLAGAHVDADELMVELVPLFEPIMHRWFNGLRSGVYDGHLEASTASRITSMLRYAAGISPLELYQVEYGRQGSPSVLVEDLVTALTAGIDELTRPIDAIKHQAKTVTVGISRSDEGVSQVPLVRSVFEAGAARDRLSYRTLRTVAELDPAIAEVIGFTRYRIEGRVETGDATIVVVDRGGISRDLPLRTEANPLLRGTKHRVAFEREVTVAVGRSDGRPVVIVPEVKGNQCSGITLLHVRFEERLPAPVMRGVLEGYRSRYAALRDAVTETEPTFRDDLLADLPVVDVLTAPVLVLASRWKST